VATAFLFIAIPFVVSEIYRMKAEALSDSSLESIRL